MSLIAERHNPPPAQPGAAGGAPPGSEAGFTLIELLVSASLSSIVGVMAATLIIFAQSSLTNASQQVRVAQAGRAALQEIMLALHSACVNPTEMPVKAGSTTSSITFINARNEATAPGSSAGAEVFAKPVKHVLSYEESKHQLAEYTYKLKSEVNATGEFTFASTAVQAAGHPRIVARYVYPAENAEKVALPFFSYYRYYEPGDEGYAEGAINWTSPYLTTLTEATARKVSAVTVQFAVRPEAKHYNEHHVHSLTLKDTAVYRLSPVSTLASSSPLPCT